jgi:hypothetical protein
VGIWCYYVLNESGMWRTLGMVAVADSNVLTRGVNGCFQDGRYMPLLYRGPSSIHHHPIRGWREGGATSTGSNTSFFFFFFH